ncbi:MAG TPA: hypothetical protein VHA55_15105 [Pseudorhodoplanes sp.]|nr:hypothetical protein [Pseudorhodoplanes sp.]
MSCLAPLSGGEGLWFLCAVNDSSDRRSLGCERGNELKAIRFKFYALTTGGIRGAYKNNKIMHGSYCRGSVRFGGARRANGR